VLFKVGGFGDAAAVAAAAAQQQPAGEAAPGGTTAALQALLAFLRALTAADGDGRVLLTRAGGAPAAAPGAAAASGRLKFTLLNPGARFAPIAAAARAVILVGGTLGPLAALSGALFPGMAPSRLRSHACGHIVPPANLLCLALGRGPSGGALDFAHRARSATAAMDELGRLLLNVCRVVPQGVVAFFPSFEYADACAVRWAASGAMDALAAVKARAALRNAICECTHALTCGCVAAAARRRRWCFASRAARPRWRRSWRATPLPRWRRAVPQQAALHSAQRPRRLRPPARCCSASWAASCRKASTSATASAGVLPATTHAFLLLPSLLAS
jgi:hypothetical protein